MLNPTLRRVTKKPPEFIDSKVMEAGYPSSPVQEKAAEDRANGERDGIEEPALLFLDSLDDYLTLLDSLSSTLRQGWLELASARHSMGSSRVSSTLLDLNVQSPATTVVLNEPVEGSLSVPQPHFMLSKWACLEERKASPKEVVDGMLLKDHISSRLRHRGPKHTLERTQENFSATSESTAAYENKQRYKSLSVFGTLVSPKLRSAQVSFETALETIVEIANMRSFVLSSFSQLQKNNEC